MYTQQRHVGQLLREQQGANQGTPKTVSWLEADSWSPSLLLVDIDERSLQQLSYRIHAADGGPAAIVDVLEPLFRNITNVAMESLDHNATVVHNQPLTCLYMQAASQVPESTRRNLQLVERMKELNISLSSCIFDAYIESLFQLRYYADAYQTTTEYIRRYPDAPEPHAWMGVALSALNRATEAVSVLHVARVLVEREPDRLLRQDKYPFYRRMADAFFFLNETVGAEAMYTRALQEARRSDQPSNHSHTNARLCDVLQPLARTHLALNMSQLAYVELLQYARDCPAAPENNVYLGNIFLGNVSLSPYILLVGYFRPPGMAQHQLNLLHDASTTLKAALKNKATKAAARAELAAVKATRKRQMDEEVRRAEEAMGPQPEVDPSLRQEYTGTYLEYIARLKKEEEEKEAREWAERRRQEQLKEQQQHGTREEAQQQPTRTAAEPSSTTQEPRPPVPAAGKPAQPDTNQSSGDVSSQQSQAIESRSEPGVGAAEAGDAHDETVSDARTIADQFLVMAEALAKKGDQAQAVKQLNKAIKRDPSHVEAHYRRAELSAALGDVKAAVADLQHIRLHLDSTHKASAELLIQKASDLALAGNVKEAVGILEHVGLSLPTDEAFGVGLATALAQQGDHVGALQALQRIDAAGSQSVEIERLRARLEVLAGRSADQPVVADGEHGGHHPIHAGAARHRPGRWVRHHGGEAAPDLTQSQESPGATGAEL